METFILEQQNIGKQTIYVVENHHHVLVPWFIEHQQKGTLPVVLTLDHHTDSLPAFRYLTMQHCQENKEKADQEAAILLQEFLPLTPEKLTRALGILRHDEHLSFALQTRLIRQSIIFSHENYAIDVHPEIIILNDPLKDEYDLTQTAPYYAQALESSFLRPLLERIPTHFANPWREQPFILDIDLDYFKGQQSINPKDRTVFYELIRRSQAITISMERTWVRLLNMDFEKNDAIFFLKEVMKHIHQATQN